MARRGGWGGGRLGRWQRRGRCGVGGVGEIRTSKLGDEGVECGNGALQRHRMDADGVIQLSEEGGELVVHGVLDLQVEGGGERRGKRREGRRRQFVDIGERMRLLLDDGKGTEGWVASGEIERGVGGVAERSGSGGARGRVGGGGREGGENEGRGRKAIAGVDELHDAHGDAEGVWTPDGMRNGGGGSQPVAPVGARMRQQRRHDERGRMEREGRGGAGSEDDTTEQRKRSEHGGVDGYEAGRWRWGEDGDPTVTERGTC